MRLATRGRDQLEMIITLIRDSDIFNKSFPLGAPYFVFILGLARNRIFIERKFTRLFRCFVRFDFTFPLRIPQAINSPQAISSNSRTKLFWRSVGEKNYAILF